MKKYIRIMLVTLLSMGIIVSCKKDDSLKDYAASIKDKTWWGEFTYTGKTTEYYSVHFNADNSLIWSNLAGDYEGKWSINGKRLTISLSESGEQIKADISDDDKLVNFEDNTGFYEIKSGALIANPNIPLDNTVWNGIISPNNGSPYSIKLSFVTGSKVAIKFGDIENDPYTYTRSASGASIRTFIAASYRVFCIIISESEMKGSNHSYDYPFEAKKQ